MPVYQGFLLSQNLRYVYVTRDGSGEKIALSNTSQQLLGIPMPRLEHSLHLAIVRGQTEKNIETALIKVGIHD